MGLKNSASVPKVAAVSAGLNSRSREFIVMNVLQGLPIRATTLRRPPGRIIIRGVSPAGYAIPIRCYPVSRLATRARI